MQEARRILLLGAGFSRNWGGWLANEALEYLLGCPQIDDSLRALLIRNKTKGFEETLGVLQAQSAGRRLEQLTQLEAALRSMFDDMNAAFSKGSFDFGGDSRSGSVSDFLRHFDAIFTLNQDTLLETHYFNNIALPAGDRHWREGCLPGMERVGEHYGKASGLWQPAANVGEIPGDVQPYIKLHGSSNWQTRDASQLLIMGTNKSAVIAKVPILQWGFDKLNEYLSGSHTRLMVIGYSFGDDHVNAVLMKAAQAQKIRLFVVDPLGMDVMDKYRDAHIPGPSELKDALWSVLYGCSRRALSATFGGDAVEYAKLLRFISG
jgi:hypothetical protein